MTVGRLRVVALGVALGVLAPGGPVMAAAAEDAARGQRPAADEVLARAATAAAEVGYAASVTVITLASVGPSMASFEVQRDEDGLRVRRAGLAVGGGDERSSPPTRLLTVAGVEPLPTQLDRLARKYVSSLGDRVQLDTGLAVPVILTERRGGQPREVLYADADTGLIVRRETFDADGDPVRLVAFTALRSDPSGAAGIGSSGGAARGGSDRTSEDGGVAGFRDAGFLVPERLPRGYGLVTAVEVPGESWPTLHLLYGDGLYTLSVFQQRGRLDRDEVAGARSVTTPGGGTVWSWPGAEPRRLVWGGGERTFTALSDAPLDELLLVLDALPVDPAPGVWERIVRGIERLGSLLWPW